MMEQIMLARFVIGMLAILLNVTVIILNLRIKSTTTASRLLLLNLAIADFLHGSVYVISVAVVLVDSSMDTKRKLSYYSVLGTAISFTASLLHITGITFDRLAAVTWPFRYKRIMTKSRLSVVCGLFWAISFGISLTLFVGSKSNTMDYFVLTLIYVSTLFIVISYAYIIKYTKTARIWRRRNSAMQNVRERRTELMCGCIVFSYIFINLTFAISDTIAVICGPFFLGKVYVSVMFLLVLLNTVLNPFLYVLLCRYKPRQSQYTDGLNQGFHLRRPNQVSHCENPPVSDVSTMPSQLVFKEKEHCISSR